jgi:hypothetical protein
MRTINVKMSPAAKTSIGFKVISHQINVVTFSTMGRPNYVRLSITEEELIALKFLEIRPLNRNALIARTLITGIKEMIDVFPAVLLNCSHLLFFLSSAYFDKVIF